MTTLEIDKLFFMLEQILEELKTFNIVLRELGDIK